MGTIDEKPRNESEHEWYRQDTIQSRLSTIDRKCERVLAEPKSKRVINEIISHYSHRTINPERTSQSLNSTRLLKRI